MYKICLILMTVLTLTFMCGCASSAYTCQTAEKEYAALKEQAESSSLTDEERYLMYARIFENISSGNTAQAGEFAELLRTMTDHTAEFSDEEVFHLAKDYAKLFNQLAEDSTVLGINDIRFKSSAQILIDYYGEIRYSVNMMDIQDPWHNGDYTVPYDGSLGKYRMQITFYDSDPSVQFIGKYLPNQVHKLADFSGYSVNIKYVYTPDHGFILYIGSDRPFHVQAQDVTTPTSVIDHLVIQLDSQ